MIIEAHAAPARELGDSVEALLGVLADSGWMAEEIFRRGRRESPNVTVHYLCRPK